MSQFRVEVVPLPKFGKHPNADSLFITNIFDYPVIFSNKEGFQKDDLVGYIPCDAMVPLNNPVFKFLDTGKGRTHERIRAKRLRGIFSMGFIIRAPEGAVPGQNVAEQLEIIKYEEPEQLSTYGEAEKDPLFAPIFTDIQNLRRYKHLLNEGELIIASEKLHGCCSMFAYRDNRLWSRSHRQYKKQDSNNLWWKAAATENLEEKLKTLGDDFCVFGEIFGSNVQDLPYGATKGQIFFRAFDIYQISKGYYLNYDEATKLAASVGINWVPELYKGAFNFKELENLIENDSKLANNLCEGTVVKPVAERFNAEVGRVIFKLISQRYLLRKGGSEHH